MAASQFHNFLSGIRYLFEGYQLVTSKGLRRFVVAPLLINLLLFCAAFWYLMTQIGDWLSQFEAWLPSFLSWLTILLWPLLIIAILMIFSLLFSTIANLIAAPFNGLLAEQVEQRLTGVTLPNSTFTAQLCDLPRIIKREGQKLAYYLPRALLLLLLYLIPGINLTIAPVLWFLFGAWIVAMQYIDFPFDNHRIRFSDMRSCMRQDLSRQLGFGSVTLLCTAIPLVNLVIIPVAVCGASAMYVDLYRQPLTSRPKHQES